MRSQFALARGWVSGAYVVSGLLVGGAALIIGVIGQGFGMWLWASSVVTEPPDAGGSVALIGFIASFALLAVSLVCALVARLPVRSLAAGTIWSLGLLHVVFNLSLFVLTDPAAGLILIPGSLAALLGLWMLSSEHRAGYPKPPHKETW